MAKNLFLIVGVVSILILGFVIFFRPAADPGALPQTSRTAEEELQYFMDDSMDYGVKLSRILAERRIRRAEEYAATNPSLAPLAQEVADSLRARLQRKAKTE